MHFILILIPSWIDLTAESAQTEGSQIEYNTPTITIQLRSLNIQGLESTSGTTFEFILSGSVGGRPYSPALLRYERDI